MFNPFRKKTFTLPERSLNELKSTTSVLFIDDKQFEVVNILKEAEWVNVRLIKDVNSLDAQEVQNAHIIFVDINGVGRKLKFKDEKIGLILALRKKYPFKKLILYSAEREGDRFHEGFTAADAQLAKNADPFQFQAMVENYSRKCFSLPECITHLHEMLRNEYGLSLSRDEVVNYVRDVAKGKNYSERAVAKIFNLQNAGSIASIISLFLKPT